MVTVLPGKYWAVYRPGTESGFRRGDVYLFIGGEAPAEPFAACGSDPVADDLPCEEFGRCP